MKTFKEIMELTSTISAPLALDDKEAGALYGACVGVALGGLVVEIGCQLGRSSSLIAQVGKEACFHHIHIDPYIDNPEYLAMWVAMMQGIGHPFTLHCMDSERASSLIVRDIDLLFVDGDHEYAAVKNDLQRYGWKVAKGGLIVLHDYNRESLPGVTQAADELLGDWDRVGVFGTIGMWRKR